MKTTTVCPRKVMTATAKAPGNSRINASAKVKRIALRIDITSSNLAQEIKRMFDMAKSSGQELDLTFSQKSARTV
jgi:hypothetical protein